MYTGYFAQLKKYQEAGLTPIAICGGIPSWYQGLWYKKLAPKWAFFNEWKNGIHKGDNDYYIGHFNSEVLDGKNPQIIFNELVSLAGCPENKIILLCYEKPFEFCHRHLVSEWFRNNNINCLEYRICK